MSKQLSGLAYKGQSLYSQRLGNKTFIYSEKKPDLAFSEKCFLNAVESEKKGDFLLAKVELKVALMYAP